MKKLRRFPFLRILLILFFLSILLYPTISNYLAEKNNSRVIASYEEGVYGLRDEDVKQYWNQAQTYNDALVGNTVVSDPFEENLNHDEQYNTLLNMDGSGLMGYLRIPKINEELPIYHGTKEQVLQKGIGHFMGSSLPIGGESSHCVLTGHRGLPSARLFTDLDELQIGDVFYLKILHQTMAYEVDQVLTVVPSETKELQIVDGQDYVTLVTCTPYAVNTHRLLVRGKRIPYEEAIALVANEIDTSIKIPFEIKMLLLGFGCLSCMLFMKRRWEAHGQKN